MRGKRGIMSASGSPKPADQYNTMSWRQGGNKRASQDFEGERDSSSISTFWKKNLCAIIHHSRRQIWLAGRSENAKGALGVENQEV